MKIKIKEVELGEDTQDWVIQRLIDKFDKESEELQEVNFPLNDNIEIYATLKLIVTSSKPDENNQSTIEHTNVDEFTLQFIGDEDEIKVKDWNYDYRIHKHYTF